MQALFKRLGSDVAEGMPVFAAGYIKRMLEGEYDALIKKTAWGQRLKRLGLPEKYSIEALINLLNAIADSELPENSFLAKMLKGVLLDAGPEISKRIINGDKISEKIGDKAKNKIGRLIGLDQIQEPKEKALANLMLELDNETLADLLAWAYGIGEEERKRTIGLIKNLSHEELAKFAGLSEESRKQMVKLLTEKPPNEKPKSQIGKKIAKDVKETLRDATSSMVVIRAKLKRIREARK